ERVQLQERAAGIDEPVDPLARGQLPAGSMALGRLVPTATCDLRRALTELGHEAVHQLAAAVENVVALDHGLQNSHRQQPTIARCRRRIWSGATPSSLFASG